MPSTSKKQHNLMEMVAHDPKAARRLGIKQAVGKDFVAADKGKKFGIGGDVKINHGGKGQINKQITRDGSIFGSQKEVPNVSINKYMGKKEGGKIMKKHDDEAQDKKLIAKMIKASEKKEDKGMKCGGKVKKMAAGGLATRGYGIAKKGK